MNNQKGIAPIIIILVLVAIIGGGTLVWQNFSAQKEEVKVPENIVKDETTDWQTYRNEEYGFEMKYPEDFLPTQSLQPKTKIIQCDYVNFINECPFAPIEGFIGTEESAFRQGLAARPTPERITVNDVSFCRQENHEGAMGTSYITYNYTTVREKKCFVVSFAVPYPNCSNHLPIESQEIQEIYDKCEYKNKVTKPETIDKMLSTFSFFEIKSSEELENIDNLMHKLFPNLEFKDGNAVSFEDSSYEGLGLKLSFSEKIEDYFINNEEKNILLVVSLDGVAHTGGMYHSYLGLFDLDGNLLTPSSSFPKPNFDNLYGDDYYRFDKDKAQFGGDYGDFGFYNCKGIKYIAFASHGCPNGTCCFGTVDLFKINNGQFEKVQTIDDNSLANNDLDLKSIVFSYVDAATGSSYGLKMILSDEKVIVKKVPATMNLSGNACPESDYKVLDWDSNTCRFFEKNKLEETIKGLFDHIVTIPEETLISNTVLRTESGEDIYLDISNVKFKYDHVFVVAKGSFDDKGIFNISQIDIDEENKYMKDRYYCEEDHHCKGSQNGIDRICSKRECINEFYYGSIISIENDCYYTYFPKDYFCKCINSSCTIIDKSSESINIISPNGGEELKRGDTYNITWNCHNNTGVDAVDIYIKDKEGNITRIASWIKSSLEKFSRGIISIFSKENSFKVQLRQAGESQLIIDESDNYFSILETSECLTEGELLFEEHKQVCCSGLTMMALNTKPDLQGKKCMHLDMSLFSCTKKCGDGVCEGRENWCNCQDCEKP